MISLIATKASGLAVLIVGVVLIAKGQSEIGTALTIGGAAELGVTTLAGK